MIVDDVLHKISWLKGPKKRLKMAKKSRLLLFANTSVQPSFSNVFKVSIIVNDYFWCFLRCSYRKRLFPTISDYCNSRCKRWSSTILRPGLVQSAENPYLGAECAEVVGECEEEESISYIQAIFHLPFILGVSWFILMDMCHAWKK